MHTVVRAMLLVLGPAIISVSPGRAAEPVELWDTAWSLPNKSTPAQLEAYFDHLAAGGFEGVWISLAPLYWQRGMADENYAGEAMKSFSNPNPGYLAYVDVILDEAAERGLQVAMAPAWGTDYTGVRPGIDGHVVPEFDDWFDPDDPGNGQKAYDYGFLLGQRWGGHPGLHSWIMGGDYWFGESEGLAEETWVMMSGGLDAAGAAQPVTYGPGGFSSSWHLFAGDPWVDYVSFNHHCLDPAELQHELEQLAVYGKPVVAAEVRYEGEDAPWCDPVFVVDETHIRADVEATVAAGAAAYVFGHDERWAWDPGAMAALGSPGELAARDVLGLTDPPAGPPPAEVLLVEPNGRWHLRLDGQDDWTFWYGVPGDVPLFGDWDGDGSATPGMYRPSSGFAYLTNELPADGSVAVADPALTFYFGIPGDQVFIGDWDGDGRDSLGINRRGRIYVRNANSTGIADDEFWFGLPGDLAHGGNTNGGGDGVFLYRPATGMVYFIRELPAGDVALPDGSFSVGSVASLALGDWNGDGIDTVAMVDAGTVQLKNTNTTAPPDATYSWGGPGWMPVGGVVDGGGA